MKLNSLYNMDCMEGMKQFPDKFFELAIVDPPYGIGVTKMNMGGRKTVKPDSRTWDDEIPSDEYFEELMRVSRHQIIWGGNCFPLPPHKCFIVWDKGESMYGRDFAECEQAWCSINKPARMIKIHPNQPDRIHPTQKPVALYRWLLSKFAKPGDKVLDTHVGSASSLIACMDMGFEFVGFELDPDYYAAAMKRMEVFNSQTRLFT